MLLLLLLLLLQNKELLGRMDEYLETNHNLEMSNVKLNKLLELNKDKNIELEAQKFEAVSGMLHSHIYFRYICIIIIVLCCVLICICMCI